MIHALRNKSNSVVAKTAFAGLALTFVFGGVGSSLIGGKSITALEVDGEKVSAQEVQREYNIKLRDIQRQLGSEPSQELLQTLALGNQTVNQIVRDRALTSEARNIGLRASDAQVLKALADTPYFQDKDGKFDADRYKSILQDSGLTAEGYEGTIRQEIQLSQLEALFQVHNMPKAYADELMTYASELLSIRYVDVTPNNIKKPKAPTAEEIAAFYEENKARLTTAEKRTFDTLVVSLAALQEAVDISDEDIRAEYDAAPDSFKTAEKRDVSHILTNTKAEAEDIIARLEKGEAFDAIAKAVSADVFTSAKGGRIGDIAVGDMEKAFTDAAFDMAVGTVSAPVETSFGWHIIKVHSETAAQQRSFSDVKNELRSELALAKAEDAYYNTLEKLDDLIASGATLSEAAKELNLSTQTQENRTVETVSGDYALQLENEVFAAEEGDISAPISADGGTTTLFTQVTAVTAPRQKTIDESRAEIQQTLQQIAEQKALSETANNLLADAKEKGLDAAARKAGFQAVSATEIDRNGNNAPSWVKSYQTQTLFRTEPGTIAKYLLNTEDGLAVVEVTSRVEDASASAETKAQYTEFLKQQAANDLYAQYARSITAAAKVDVNAPVLESIMGDAYKAAK